MAQTAQRQTHCKSTIRNSGRLRNATHHSMAVVWAVVCAVVARRHVRREAHQAAETGDPEGDGDDGDRHPDRMMEPLGVRHDRLKAREVGRLDQPARGEAGHRAPHAAVDEALCPEQDRDRDQEAGVKRNEGAARRAEDQRQNERRHVPDEGQRQRPGQDRMAAARQVGRALQLEQRIAFDQREAARARRLGPRPAKTGRFISKKVRSRRARSPRAEPEFAPRIPDRRAARTKR